MKPQFKETYLGLVYIILTALFNLAVNDAEAAEGPTEPLTVVAVRVLSEGKEASMNGGFATFLGLTKNQQPLSIKRITSAITGTTNSVSVSLEDKKTIILSTRRHQLTTYYLTDRSGKLIRAVINDSKVIAGGLTNIPVATAQAAFEDQKNWWLKDSTR